jgi:hypothetical protein
MAADMICLVGLEGNGQDFIASILKKEYYWLK